jgi:hypothetical protein
MDQGRAEFDDMRSVHLRLASEHAEPLKFARPLATSANATEKVEEPEEMMIGCLPGS